MSVIDRAADSSAALRPLVAGEGSVEYVETRMESVIPSVRASSVPVVTAATMAEVDRQAIKTHGVGLLQMMEQAGSHLAEVVRLELGGDLRDRSVVVVAGPGNNGGGGLAAARHLANRGARVRVILARPVLRMSLAARHQIGTLITMGTTCCVATWDLADEELVEALDQADIVVDALLGYGTQGAPYGEPERLIGFIVRSGRPVVSLDVPSGVDPDSGASPGLSLMARATLALALPKPGLLHDDARDRVGRLYLGDLGLPAALYHGLGLSVGPLFIEGRIVILDRSA
jgi:NAD(P)H-hydrate epimerase